MRKPSLRHQTSLELHPAAPPQLPRPCPANLGDSNPRKQAQSPQTQAGSQVGSLSRVGSTLSTPALPVRAGIAWLSGSPLAERASSRQGAVSPSQKPARLSGLTSRCPGFQGSSPPQRRKGAVRISGQEMGAGEGWETLKCGS